MKADLDTIKWSASQCQEPVNLFANMSGSVNLVVLLEHASGDVACFSQGELLAETYTRATIERLVKISNIILHKARDE